MSEKDFPVQYELFQPYIKDIEQNAPLIGEGAESKVYSIEIANKNYAIKIAKSGVRNIRDRIKDRGLMTKASIESGLLGVDIKGIEQFVTGSTEDYAAVYQLVSGFRLTEATNEMPEQVTYEQKEAFYESVAKATDAGLAFDSRNPSGANSFYSPELGFTLIDYEKAYWRLTYKENLSAAINSLGPIACRLFSRR